MRSAATSERRISLASIRGGSVSSRSCSPRSAPLAGIIYVAFFRSFIPTAGQFRELDGISSIIIGGGSIFGGYGTMIGSLAGAAVITLIRSLL